MTDKQWDDLVDPTRIALEALITSGDNMSDRIKELEAKLETTRRDALEEAAMVAYEHFPVTQDMESTNVCNALEDVAAAIRALIAQDEPTT